jgi:hypothetical protein
VVNRASLYKQVTPTGFLALKALPVVWRHELRAMRINQFLATIFPEDLGNDKRFSAVEDRQEPAETVSNGFSTQTISRRLE